MIDDKNKGCAAESEQSMSDNEKSVDKQKLPTDDQVGMYIEEIEAALQDVSTDSKNKVLSCVCKILDNAHKQMLCYADMLKACRKQLKDSNDELEMTKLAFENSKKDFAKALEDKDSEAKWNNSLNERIASKFAAIKTIIEL
jgi:dGTP triphosphohydrolase